MDNGSVAEIAGGGSDIAINTLSSSSGTGGGSATFNGSAYRFTLSAPPSVSAQQLLVSINGVIQKPVAGTGQPSEGFAVDGTDIILGDAPATGSDFFILTFKSLGVSEPADNSVTSAKIVDGTIVNADINANAAIDVSKLSGVLPLAGGTLVGNLSITREQPVILFNDSTDNPDYYIGNIDGSFRINDTTNSVFRLVIDSSGNVGIGTTSPKGKLDIDASTLDAAGDTDDSTDYALVIRNPSSTGQGNGIAFTNDGGTNIGGAIIHIDQGSNNIGDLAFYTAATSNTPLERMRIASDGNVGIGTSSPNANLEISKGSEGTYLKVGGDNASNGRALTFTSSTDGSNGALHTINASSGNGVIALATGGSERMRIDSSGDVLVGLTTALNTQSGSIQAAGPIIAKSYINAHTSNATVIEYISNVSKIRAYGATSGSGILAFNTGGGGGSTDTERVRIDSSGNLLHGVTASENTTGNSGTKLITAGDLQIDGDQKSLLFRSTANTAQKQSGIQWWNENGAGVQCAIFGVREAVSQAPAALTFSTSSNVDTTANNGEGDITDRVRITSSGNIYMGDSVNASGLVNSRGFIFETSGTQQIITSSTAVKNVMEFGNPNGNVGRIQTSGSGTSYLGSSDYRLKENAVAISDGITRLKTLKPYRFNWKSDPTTTVDGFFAHEVTAVPEAISGTKDEVALEDNEVKKIKKGDPIYQMIDHSKLVPLLVAALQEAIGRIEALEAK